MVHFSRVLSHCPHIHNCSDVLGKRHTYWWTGKFITNRECSLTHAREIDAGWASNNQTRCVLIVAAGCGIVWNSFFTLLASSSGYPQFVATAFNRAEPLGYHSRSRVSYLSLSTAPTIQARCEMQANECTPVAVWRIGPVVSTRCTNGAWMNVVAAVTRSARVCADFIPSALNDTPPPVPLTHNRVP